MVRHRISRLCYLIRRLFRHVLTHHFSNL
jgi:hypothetical protein